jgi:3-oxoacyl-[acyl-carrier protein] reductase
MGVRLSPSTAVPQQLSTDRQEVAITARTALVVGGSAGIGLATAVAFAGQGHRLTIAGRRAEPLARAAEQLRALTGEPVATYVLDVSDPVGTTACVADVEKQSGPLDILVLNAGGPPPGRILALDDDQWQRAFELLVMGPLRLARAALPGMAERGFGRVVALTSTAVRQPQPDLAASVVLRSALTAAAKLLAREHAAAGVTVNCVAPGATATERRREILEHRAQIVDTSLLDEDAADAAQIPAGRAARPEEVAAAVAFLASDAAGYVNGTVLAVDGGRTETI